MPWVGKSVERYEDPELLRGKGRYIADVTRPGMLHAAFVRSPYPHARIRGVDVTDALAVEGVVAVLTGDDLPADLGQQPCNHLFHGQRDTPYFALVRDRARYVGEPVAVVVAESLYVAEDARELVVVDCEELQGVGERRGGARRGRAAALRRLVRQRGRDLRARDRRRRGGDRGRGRRRDGTLRHRPPVRVPARGPRRGRRVG